MSIYGISFSPDERMLTDQQAVNWVFRKMYAEAEKSCLSVREPHTIVMSRTPFGYRYHMEWRR